MATADGRIPNDTHPLIENEVENDESNTYTQWMQPQPMRNHQQPTHSNQRLPTYDYNEQRTSIQPSAPVDLTQPILDGLTQPMLVDLTQPMLFGSQQPRRLVKMKIVYRLKLIYQVSSSFCNRVFFPVFH